ncbi:YjcZ family sporulation protein [Neobacillus sp. Marseille-QA0830]
MSYGFGYPGFSGYGYGGFGYGGGFALIVVLFILLIIVGAVCFY